MQLMIEGEILNKVKKNENEKTSFSCPHVNKLYVSYL